MLLALAFLGSLPHLAHAQTVRIERVQSVPNEEAAIAQRIVRRFQGVVRSCFERGGEGEGAGRLVLRAALENGRVTQMVLVSRSGTPNETAVQCALQQLRGRVRAPADSPLRQLMIPIRFEYPELQLPQGVRAEARDARRRARCLRDTADQLIAAVRAFERSRGRARRRAHERVEAARTAMAACDGGQLQMQLQLNPGLDLTSNQGLSTR